MKCVVDGGKVRWKGGEEVGGGLGQKTVVEM